MCHLSSSARRLLKYWHTPWTTLKTFINTSDIFQRHEENLALPSVEKAALECVKAGLETWEYKAKNALMYYPEGKTKYRFNLFSVFGRTFLLKACYWSHSAVKEKWNFMCFISSLYYYYFFFNQVLKTMMHYSRSHGK